MKRDIDFLREALLDVEVNAQPLGVYCVSYAMTKKGYDDEYVCAQISLMIEAGLFISPIRSGISWNVSGLSNRGYDLLETIRNDTVWQKTKATLEEKKLPKTLDWIAQIAGIFVGKLLKNIKG